MRLEHIGYITGDIDETKKAFEVLGYSSYQIFDDNIQKCFITFLERNSCEPRIELVQPYEDNKTMQKLLQKGVAPYHLCYEVEDVFALYEKLSKQEGWIPIFPPVEAVAFNNRMITYFMNYEVGYIEFVNNK